MSVTLKDVREHFPSYYCHEQIGSKQLFICSGYNGRHPAHNHNKILVSYRTIVGYYDAMQDTWYLTTRKYSPTTSKQLTQFARGRNVTWTASI